MDAIIRGVTWKEKHLDYEIETKGVCRVRQRLPGLPWKEKHLDYEIETRFKHIFRNQRVDKLEKKSISITRLKRMIFAAADPAFTANLKRKASRLRDWNLKERFGLETALELEKKSISITRLKHAYFGSLETATIQLEKKSISITRLKPATWRRQYPYCGCQKTWKEKHLDYEIETGHRNGTKPEKSGLKRKASRLRDWNWLMSCVPWKRHLLWRNLKRKASRLRDWNITSDNLKNFRRFTWKEKHLDYEIETM